MESAKNPHTSPSIRALGLTTRYSGATVESSKGENKIEPNDTGGFGRLNEIGSGLPREPDNKKKGGQTIVHHHNNPRCLLIKFNSFFSRVIEMTR